MSISHGQVPMLLKEETVRPLLKKPSLDIDVLAYYRPVSNLTQLSKILENVIAQQLLIHTDTSLKYINPHTNHNTPQRLNCYVFVKT